MGDKKPKRKRKPVQAWKYFEKKGDTVERKKKSCPKCGQGFFMGQHQNRWACGRCKYTEFGSRKAEGPKK